LLRLRPGMAGLFVGEQIARRRRGRRPGVELARQALETEF